MYKINFNYWSSISSSGVYIMPEDEFGEISNKEYETIDAARFAVGEIIQKTIANSEFYINKIDSLYQEYKKDEKYKDKIEDIFSRVLYPEQRHQKGIVKALELAYEATSSQDWTEYENTLPIEGDQKVCVSIKIHSEQTDN